MKVRRMRGKGGRIGHLVREDGSSLCGYLPCRTSKIIAGLRVPTKWVWCRTLASTCQKCIFQAKQLGYEVVLT